MKRLRTAAVSCLLLAFASAAPASAAPPRALPAQSAPRTPRHDTFVPGQVVVLLAAPGDLTIGGDGAVTPRDARLAGVLARHGLVTAKRLGPDTPQRASTLVRLHSNRPDFDPIAAAADLVAGGARAACPNYRIPVHTTFPNDSMLANQWYIYQASPRADIHLPEAWDLEKGSNSTTIAILDMGVDLSQRDLAAHIWTNPGEIPGNGIDDDHDGLVDDVHGWDFGDNDADPNPQFTPDPDVGVDFGFHGTYCAGLAGAVTNNVTGIAGASWNCTIVPLKAAKADSGLSTDAVAAGMEYAAAKHFNVLSMSFGAANDTLGQAHDFFQALVNDDIAAGVICVAAAGNDGDSSRVFPAACDGVISVGATTNTNARASFSNWGPWVSVAAPGMTMWSTICTNYVIDDFSQFWYEFFWNWDGVNPYMFGDGTSFACPLVAGVCGLIHSHLPSISPAAVKSLLISTGDVVAYDHPIGVKVNAFRAVSQAVLGVDAAAAPGGLQLSAAPNPASGASLLRMTLPRAGTVRLTIFDCAGRVARELVSERLGAGVHDAPWDGRDGTGAALPAGLYFARLDAAGRQAITRIVRLDR